MKKLNVISLLLICMFLITNSCENDDVESNKLNSSLYWVSFVETSTSVVENSSDLIKAKISLSANTQDADIPITYSVSSPDGAVAGIDYTLPSGFGSAVITAGSHFLEIELATLVNDDIVEGDKTLVFTIESAGNFNVGLPNTKANASYTVIIKEDDFTVIAYTSFEEPIGGTGYNDLVNNDVDHDLVNNPGDASVDYVSTGGELGFDTTFISTRVFTSPNGLDNEKIGVLNTPNRAPSFTDGSQGYSFSDTDGLIRVTFDPVDLSTFTNQVFISLDLFINSTSYEVSASAVAGNPDEPDKLRIYLIVDEGEQIDIVNLIAGSANELEGFNEGIWQELTMDLTGFTSAQLVVEMDTNVDAEGATIDNIRFLGL